MNCANHADAPAAAYCRTCGKPLCAACSRDVKGVIYCESCLAARLEAGQPQQTVYQPVVDQGVGPRVPITPTGGPNPALAGILAGFFPVGVGAVYNGQYAKGLAHLLIFTGFIWGLSSTTDSFGAVLGLGLAFFYFYQIIDAVRSAKAIQLGQPAPDPFGLGRTFSSGDRVDTSRIPVGAVILIGMGVLFMLHNLGLRWFSFDRFWPLILIGIGAWLFVRRWGLIGGGESQFDCERCRARALMGPAVVVTLGLLFLLQEQYVVGLHRTWPILLVVIGLVKMYQNNASPVGHVEGGSGAPPIIQGSPAAQPSTHSEAPTSEVKHG